MHCIGQPLVGVCYTRVAAVGATSIARAEHPTKFVRLREELLNGFVGDHLFLEDVSTRLRGLDHLDDLRVGTTVGLLE